MNNREIRVDYMGGNANNNNNYSRTNDNNNEGLFNVDMSVIVDAKTKQFKTNQPGKKKIHQI